VGNISSQAATLLVSLFQLADHIIEGVGESGEISWTVLGYTDAEITVGDRIGCRHDVPQWPGDAPERLTSYQHGQYGQGTG